MYRLVWLSAALLVAAGALLPVDRVLDVLGARFRTIADFRSDYRAGLQILRLALVGNGLFLLAMSWIWPRLRSETAKDVRPELWPMALLAALTAAMILPVLRSSFQQDEYRCLLEYISHGPAVILTRSTGADNHILYSLLAWPSVKILGASEVGLRLPALLLTSLAPGFLFAILRREYSIWLSLLGALPLALAHHLLYWGHEARAYGPLVTFVLALAWMQPKIGDRRWWIAYVVLGALAVWLHIFAGAAVAALALAGILRDRSSWLRHGFAFAGVAALSLLAYSVVLPQYFAYSKVSGQITLVHLLPHEIFSTAFVGTLPVYWALPFAFALSLSLRKLHAWPPFLLTAAFLAVLLFATRGEHTTRFYAPAAALLWIPIAHGVADTFRCRPGGLITLLALLVATAAADARQYRLGKRDCQAAARELAARWKPDERVALFHDCRPVQAYTKIPAKVLKEPEVRETRPEWFLIAEMDLDLRPEFQAWVHREYEVKFTLPSTGGDVRGYRLISSR